MSCEQAKMLLIGKLESLAIHGHFHHWSQSLRFLTSS